MTTKIDEWGNSLAVRIPRRMLETASFRKGTEVEFKATESGILISRAQAPSRRRRRKYRLSDLLAGCKGSNPYKHISGGPPVGRKRM